MITYCVDTNTILSQPIQNISDTELVTACTTIQQNLVKHCFKPQLNILDSKTPKVLNFLMTEVDEKIQLTP